ncbi:MAG: serine hydrolase [Trueperaceae bacterium]|nr:serine hydrolase [Trueperaceae bacterium]
MDIRQLEHFIFGHMTESGLPGLSLALVAGGEVVYRGGFGHRDLVRGRAATPDTLYGVGSITKSLTALAVMQLAEEGRLELSDPVDTHLPIRLEARGEVVRLEHLLSHTSGFPALAYSEALLRSAHHIGGRPLPIASPEDVMRFMHGADDWAEAAPGERWFYFNEGYALLGLIIENLSGQPYDDYIRERILEPLGMTRSFFSADAVANADDVAVPYVLYRDGRAPEPGRYLYRTIRSEGGLISSANDLSRYLTMWLEHGGNIISQDSYREMVTPRVAEPKQTAPYLFGDNGNARPARHYGYGLSVQNDFFGGTLVGHGGSVLVSTAQLAFIPERQVGVAVLANGSGYPTAHIAQVALALLLDEDPATLPFWQIEHTLTGVTGYYQTYQQTMSATLKRRGDFLELTIHDDAQPQTVILVPEDISNEREQHFFTLSAGQRLPVTICQRDDRTELIYERYKFRRSGPLT